MKQVVEFLTLLHENNDKAWFDSHKEMYKRALSCFEEFTAKLIDGIAAFDPSVRGLTVKDCTWRIFRDTRFSPDKTPYKTHMGAFVAPRGKKGGYSGYYFHVEPVWDERSWSHGHQLTTGLYCPLPEVLRSVRDEILDNGAEIEAAIREAKGFVLDESNKLKRLPIIGSRFGQGESQLEVDRRLIRNKIAALRRELKQVEQRRDVQSKSRIESPAFRVALAGYTNAGKSTLLNRLTGSTVLSQDKLFATLDPTTRSYRLPGGRGMTITDTVGFIQKLPHGLVDAFKSTLSEVLGADLILKVVDASDEDYERQLEAVDRVLDEIGAGERLTLTVFNKIDLLDSVDRLSFRRRYPEAVLFSAQTGEGLDDLVDRIAREAAATDVLLSADIPYREGALITVVHEQGTLLHEEYLEDGVRIVAKLPARIAPRLERYRTE